MHWSASREAAEDKQHGRRSMREQQIFQAFAKNPRGEVQAGARRSWRNLVQLGGKAAEQQLSNQSRDRMRKRKTVVMHDFTHPPLSCRCHLAAPHRCHRAQTIPRYLAAPPCFDERRVAVLLVKVRRHRYDLHCAPTRRAAQDITIRLWSTQRCVKHTSWGSSY